MAQGPEAAELKPGTELLLDVLRVEWERASRLMRLLEIAADYIERVPDDRLNAEHIDRDRLLERIKMMGVRW